ncbi:2-succinyl-5-enolpyruvyl-6-hydroxy-3-cyclohexene-1-carboxylic-acid synthase [Vibrio sp. B1Z05]|uniref:2-succinyl-5-enolpyruvyl-6-hydroxy-3- cyclohexene-1-carboxylic-acid synthase n=1 Tax=Vibrio sp. B1Z05 TaxID=2654980 RepID=UPI00128E62F4|nr:2-succinyl-5-enolpyruvyl-6-hydroxy-3-cyclohexene-1-carboxylic-acid synthase [Vibrio sp. B1Z05]MPW37131.1 2-succinyl-5-enolpyruvyl-6-hydroxy-3-cyclohexene-1-carboxylic-acid synthase [Vibrio sp. B1Z05]
MSKRPSQQISLKQLSQAQINRVWSSVLLEEASRFGAKHVCIAPGSRSTPLALEAIEHNELVLHTHFDERGLGFFALGIAKSTQQPVIVIVTSGTAVANLLPAVVEANLTGEKLILLTADRPVELVGVGANQAIVQQGIFSTHVSKALALPSPSAEIDVGWLLSKFDEALATQAQLKGPIHINCPFPEPLYVAESPRLAEVKELAEYWLCSKKTYLTQTVNAIDDSDTLFHFVQKHRHVKGLIIVGRLAFEKAQQVKALAEQLGWPILCDPQSGISSDWSCYDVWLQNQTNLQQLAQCEAVLQFGARLVSKRLLSFIKQKAVDVDFKQYALVCDEPGELNPDHLPMQRFSGKWSLPLSFVESSDNGGWADGLKAARVMVVEETHSLISETLTELEVATKLHEITQGYPLFLGNSLGVRLVDMACANLHCEVFSNRGASGIDGIVATSAGVGAGLNKPTLTFIGDTSLLHDLNSLSLLANSGGIVLLLNNDGGAIFDMLPVDENHKQRLYQMPHAYQFAHAAQQFNMDYQRPTTWQKLKQAMTDFEANSSRSLLIEVVTPAGQASAHIKSLCSTIQGL